MKFDAAGNQLASFGAGMFIFPHRITLYGDSTVWVVAGRTNNDRERKLYPQDAAKGHTVVKFSPDGKSNYSASASPGSPAIRPMR